MGHQGIPGDPRGTQGTGPPQGVEAGSPPPKLQFKTHGLRGGSLDPLGSQFTPSTVLVNNLVMIPHLLD